MSFKVNDKVTVIGIRSSFLHISSKLGMTGEIVKVDNGDIPYEVKVNNGSKHWFYEDDLELIKEATEKDKVFTLKEAMKLCIDGTKMQPMLVNDAANHMYFDGKDFMYYTNDTIGHSKARGVLEQNQWKIFVEPPKPPKFTSGTLVFNTDGTIGKVVEDKGVYKGVRRYSVRFNAVRDAVKGCDESELTAYESR